MRKKRNYFLGLSLLFVFVLMGVIAGCYLYDKPIIMFNREHTAEMCEEYNPYPYINFLFMGGNSDIEVIGDVDTTKAGTYSVSIVAREQQIPVTVDVVDTKPPVITLKSLRTDTKRELTVEDFIEDAYDAQEITYTFTEDTLKTINQIGSSKVSIIAEDAEGNRTKVNTNLQRIDDVTEPTITGLELEYTTQVGVKLKYEGIGVTDDLDLSPSFKVNDKKVDYNTIGDYEVSITAKDISGNSKTLTRVVHVVENPKWEENIVYLTFDDGPSENTRDILEILDKYDAKATFFVTGNNHECNKYIKEAYEAGHTIGLHTYTHNYDVVYANEDSYFKDLEKISNMVEEITGEKSTIIRFPGGSSNTVSCNTNIGIMSRLTQQVTKKGYQYFDWNVSSGDASGGIVSADTIAKNSKTSEEGNLVILMHDVQGKETTVEALESVIKYYKKRGFKFEGLTMESFPAHHGVNN